MTLFFKEIESERTKNNNTIVKQKYEMQKFRGKKYYCLLVVSFRLHLK